MLQLLTVFSNIVCASVPQVFILQSCPVLQLKKDSRSSDESISDDDVSNGVEKSGTRFAADGKGLEGLTRNGLSAHRMQRK